MTAENQQKKNRGLKSECPAGMLFHKRRARRMGGGEGEMSVMWVGDNVVGGRRGVLRYTEHHLSVLSVADAFSVV